MPILEDNTLWIKKARLGFPQLLVPKAVAGGEPKYSANFILDLDAPEWAEMVQIAMAMATAKWGENTAGVMALIKQDKRLRCYGKGEEKLDKNGKVYDGFGGKLYISASNKNQPNLYGGDAQLLPPTAPLNQLFAGGNYCSGVISFWLQDNSFGRGIRANLDGVQFVSEGEHFGATGPDAGAIFQPIPGAPATTAPGAGEAPVTPVIDFL